MTRPATPAALHKLGPEAQARLARYSAMGVGILDARQLAERPELGARFEHVGEIRAQAVGDVDGRGGEAAQRAACVDARLRALEARAHGAARGRLEALALRRQREAGIAERAGHGGAVPGSGAGAAHGAAARQAEIQPFQ